MRSQLGCKIIHPLQTFEGSFESFNERRITTCWTALDGGDP